MAIGVIGRKLGMTQIFDQKGSFIPVTLIKVGKCYISYIKDLSKDGYNAIQVAYVEENGKKVKISKPELGHFHKKNLPPSKHLKEFQLSNPLDFQLGQDLSVDMFSIGEKLKISGKTIGKGNLGNIKRNNFHRGGMAHGSKHHRLQGSLGAGTTPGRVFPGKRMPGRSGFENRTILNMQVMDINLEENVLFIKGSIPGKKGNLIRIEKEKND